MGLANIKERWGRRADEPLRGLGVLDTIGELLAKDRIPVDLAAAIVLGRFNILTSMRGGATTEELTLPNGSVEIIDKVLQGVAQFGYKKGMARARQYAHEYIGNPQIISLLIEFSEALKPTTRPKVDSPWGEERYERDRKEAMAKFNSTLIQLAAARLHLTNRREQWTERKELEELYRSIDSDVFRRVAANRSDMLEWLA
jgi:hypothetical protein